jgi:peptidoglycan/xylan/chitin deacetylase (PgdA/CDA1 family)
MWRNCPVGGWELWNELAGRGHEIMPHGWDHANLTGIPFADACRNIDRCLEAFRNNLKGFRQEEAVFNFPYNSSTPALEMYLEMKVRVRGYRAGGGGAVNRWPSPETRRVTVSAFGPGNCEEHLDHELGKFLVDGPGASEAGVAQLGRPAVATVAPGWFVYNLHGLDSEGWGPVTTDYLKRLLERLGGMETVEVIPAAAALRKYGARAVISPS